MLEDCRGLTLTAADGDAVRAYDHTVQGYLGLAVDTGERLKAVFGQDARMPMAHVLKGYFFMLMASKPLQAKAREIKAGIADALADASPREQAHADAMDAWAHGRTEDALRHWEAILAEHPLDVVALRLAHHGYFYRGDSQNLRDGVARALYAWDDSVPGYGYVMGMRAFGLEETHAYDTAVEAGEAALAINPNDPWAIHAVAHVHEMTDQPAEGIDWITRHEDGWTGANNFRYHIWWHRALMRLDRGEYDEALALYDDSLWDADSDEYLDLCNDAALLLRLELHGVDVGDRWRALADKCTGRTGDHILAFIDAHFALALAADGRPEADALLASLRAYGGDDANGDNARVSREVGVPAAAALVAYKTGDMDRVCELLAPIRYRLPEMGGSHAQRDLWSMVLLDAAIRAGREDLSPALAAERLCRMPQNAWTHAAYERVFAN
ncbi:MAG: tetratricopeptide repeat protein [Magnetovibrio sp.]|nr:tetratricopeptide repeat protein [Magnetovibrio sp.]